MFEWDYIDRYTNIAKRSTTRVTYADNERVEFDGGVVVYDQVGGVLKYRGGTKKPANLNAPAELAAGKRWRSAFTNTRTNGKVENNFWDFHLIGLEDVTVPAGTFEAYRVEGTGMSTSQGGGRGGQRQFAVDHVFNHFLSTYERESGILVDVHSAELLTDAGWVAPSSVSDSVRMNSNNVLKLHS